VFIFLWQAFHYSLSAFGLLRRRNPNKRLSEIQKTEFKAEQLKQLDALNCRIQGKMEEFKKSWMCLKEARRMERMGDDIEGYKECHSGTDAKMEGYDASNGKLRQFILAKEICNPRRRCTSL
jgi:hypothetical protein